MMSLLHLGFFNLFFFVIVFNTIHMDVWESGLIQLPAKEPYLLGTTGSNPVTSAKGRETSRPSRFSRRISSLHHFMAASSLIAALSLAVSNGEG